MRLSNRLKGVAPSATLALAQKAKELKQAGQDVVSLTAGEPDFACAPHIVQAMKDALDRGETRYVAVSGLPELREVIRAQYAARNLDYALDEIIVSTGAKQALFNAAMCLLEEGDEAIITAPYWLSYADMVRIAGAQVVQIQTHEEDGFVLSPGALEAAITERTRLLVLNSPSNPSGAVYSKEQLSALAEVLRKHPQIVVLCDEIYTALTYQEGGAPSLLEVAPDLKDRALVIDGVSKTYAMTGLRIGWALGPKTLVSAMGRLQGQSTSNANAPAQHAAVAALTGDQGFVQEMVQAFDTRRRFVHGRLLSIPHVRCFEPKGAFYIFPNLGAYVGRNLPDGTPVNDTYSICAHLLHEFGLVVVPGGPFGAPQHIRMSFAADMDTLSKALDRFREGLLSLT